MRVAPLEGLLSAVDDRGMKDDASEYAEEEEGHDVSHAVSMGERLKHA
jgi:hypothetical protein